MDINQPVFEFPVTICYEDTDVGGLAYHANFLKYFEPCCSEWLAYIGATHKSLREQNSVFVVRHVDKGLLQGARLEDRLIIKANVAKALKASVSFCQEIVNDAGDILCKAMVKVACIDSDKMKPIAFPQKNYYGVNPK